MTSHRSCTALVVITLLGQCSISMAAATPEQKHPTTADQPVDIDFDEARSKQSVPGWGEKRSKPLQYVIGASVTSAPRYEGSVQRRLVVRPVLAFKYGRYRLSTSGGSAVMNFGQVQQASGASADLLNTKKLKLKASLRISSGRRASASEDLAGIPEIRKTVLLRLSSNYEITDRWRTGTTLSYDLLGRGSGLSLATGIGYVWPYSNQTTWNVDANLVFGDRTNMNAYFGVPASAQTASRDSYSPGTGIRGAGVSVSFMSALQKQIVLFGRVGYSQALGKARDSPLTTQPNTTFIMFGIAYRCC